jgi:hypothetical protein
LHLETKARCTAQNEKAFRVQLDGGAVIKAVSFGLLNKGRLGVYWFGPGCYQICVFKVITDSKYNRVDLNYNSVSILCYKPESRGFDS